MIRHNIEEIATTYTNKFLTLQARMNMDEVSCDYSDNSVKQFVYYNVLGYSVIWNEEDIKQPYEYMSDLFIGMFSANAPVSIIFKGNNNRVETYIGTDFSHDIVLKKLLTCSFPSIKFKHNGDKYKQNNCSIVTSDQIIDYQLFTSGGYIKGNPGIPKQNNLTSGINKIISGMADSNWIIMINALSQNRMDTLSKLQSWLFEASNVSELLEVSFNDTDGKESTSHCKKYSFCEKYFEKVNYFCEELSQALETGEWLTTINYGAENLQDANLLSSLFASAFYGDISEPEPIHVIRNSCGFVPIANGNVICHNDYNGINYSRISNNFSSNEVGIVGMLPIKDSIGFSVDDYVEFDVSQSYDGNVSFGNILYNGVLTDVQYKVDVNSFNRHCLVIGLTGGGKTNTIKSIFNSVYQNCNVPFLILEPVKREYWELYKCGFDDLQVYSIGSNRNMGNPYCINPFERIGNIPIQTHIDYIFSAFKASFIMYTPMPYVLEMAIHEIYKDCGWNINNDHNPNGNIYPTIEDLYYKIPSVVTDMGYDSKMRNDLIGSLQARVNSLRIGNKGQTLNVRKSFDIKKILQGHVVIELEDIGDDEVKSFIMSIFLIQLSEYRKQQSDCQTSIRHMLLIEEAHRLLKNVQSGTGENADPRGAAVEFFCNLLAELRSKGQGFVIADQIPSKLAPDLIKNTNIKILHRTVDETERLLMGGAMHMKEEQIEQIASFNQGIAALYSEGDNRPKLVRTKYAKEFEVPQRRNLTREQVILQTKSNCFSNKDYIPMTERSYGCKQCSKICDKHYTSIVNIVGEPVVEEVAKRISEMMNSHCTAKDIRLLLTQYISRYSFLNDTEKRQSVNCLMLSALDKCNISSSSKEKIVNKFNYKGE